MDKKDPTRPKSRRPIGRILWSVSPEFTENLRALLLTRSSVLIAKEVSDYIGYEVSDSMLRRLKMGNTPTSVLAGPMSVLYGWVVPPPANNRELFGFDASQLYEMTVNDPERYMRIRAYIEAEFRAYKSASRLQEEE